MTSECRTVVCTIISANYLARARVLMNSLRDVHPEWDREVLLVDKIADRFDPSAENFGVTEVAALPIASRQRFFFRYSVMELNTAAKAPFLKWLFEERGYDRVIYLDPDIVVYSPLREVEEAFDAGALMCLTPHLTGITADDKKPTELEILVAGTYNLGFIGLARHPQLIAFLDWWWDKLEFDCVVDFEAGLFVDQKWIDLVPGIFDDVRVIRHEGYDVAYWNLGHRRVRGPRKGGEEGFRVNDDRLVFFHFSGLDPLDPGPFSKHQDRFTLQALGDERALVETYCVAVLTAGHEVCRGWHYAYDSFRDGAPIANEIRSLYRRDEKVQRAGGEDPFRIRHGYFNEPCDASRVQPAITRLLHHIWSTRPDLQRHFPDPLGASRADLVYGFVEHIAADHALPEPYVRPLRESLKQLEAAEVKRRGLRQRLRRALARLRPLAKPLPFALRRRLNALLFPAGAATGPAPGEAPGSRRPLPDTGLDYVGFHPGDAHDRAVGEVWMARRAELRLRRCQLGGALRIEGRHHAEHIESAHSSGELRILAAIDGEPVGDIVLKKGGVFSETLELGGDLPESCTLSLEANRAFVPKDQGLGEDPRELAVRISRIAVGRQAVMDFGDPSGPFVGPKRLRGEASGINILGYVHAELGIGESARLCAAAAVSAELPVSLVDFEGGCSSRTGDDRWSEQVSRDNPHPVNVIHINADQLPVAYAHFGREFFADRYNIGVWHWELPSFPDEWLPSFSLLQEVWAPTRFILEAVAEKSPIPVVLMPHAICFERPGDAARERFGLPADDFLFLTMYDMHSFQPRKNPEAVVEAFRRAFPNPKGVGLVVKVMNAELCPAEFAALQQRLSQVGGFHLLDETLSRQDVYRLESVCDSFVSLHRSEGFGLGLAESMYLGKPVIGTAWSGNVDFMSAENSCPVRYRLREIEEDVGPYKQGQLWAEADRDHAAEYMRRLVEDREFRHRIAQAGQQTIETQHSPEAIGERYKRRLEIIAQPSF